MPVASWAVSFSDHKPQERATKYAAISRAYDSSVSSTRLSEEPDRRGPVPPCGDRSNSAAELATVATPGPPRSTSPGRQTDCARQEYGRQQHQTPHQSDLRSETLN